MSLWVVLMLTAITCALLVVAVELVRTLTKLRKSLDELDQMRVQGHQLLGSTAELVAEGRATLARVDADLEVADHLLKNADEVVQRFAGFRAPWAKGRTSDGTDGGRWTKRRESPDVEPSSTTVPSRASTGDSINPGTLS